MEISSCVFFASSQLYLHGCDVLYKKVTFLKLLLVVYENIVIMYVKLDNNFLYY